MAYQHPRLAMALGWKFNHQPGMCTSEGALTAWPEKVWPTEAEQAQTVAEYEVYLTSAQAKHDVLQRALDSPSGHVLKAILGVLADKGICTMADIQAKYRGLS